MKKPAAKRPAPKQEVTKADPAKEQERLVAMRVERSWVGPLPDPQSLQRFDDIVPGAAARIINAWEGETSHRHSLERRDLNWGIIEGILGKVLAFLFVVTALGVSGYALYLGSPWFAALIGTGTIASVVAAFVSVNRGTGK